MTQIIQDFMAFQIHITHLEQAVVCANERLTNYLVETKGEIDPQYYKKFQMLNNFLLLLYDIHGIRSCDVISYCTKIWRRAVDCHQELKNEGKLKVFITAANGCLVTIVRVIDAVAMLKNQWDKLPLKVDKREIKLDEDWTTLDKLINEHIEDATEKLEAVDVEVHLTRQKILDIKKPSIRILEVAQMDVNGDFIHISENPGREKTIVDAEQLKSFPLVPNAVERSVKKSATLELGEIVENEIPPVVTSIQTKPSEALSTTTSVPIDMPSMQISAATTLTTNFQPTPSLQYPTMSTLPMQAQLIPTIQMDAFGNQSIVYQLTYQQVTPTIPTQTISNSLDSPLAGIVIPGYNGSPFQTPNHQTSPPLLSMNTSLELQPPQQEINNPNNAQNQVPFHYATLVDNNLEDQVIVVKPEPGTENENEVKVKEDPENEIKSTVIEKDMMTYVKQEPEWNEEVE